MTNASLKGFIKVGNIIFSSRFLHCDLSPPNPARSRRGPTGCRVLVKRCNPKIMSDYGTLSLTSRDSAVTPLTEKKPLPMPPAIFGFIDVLNTSLPQEKAKHQVNRRTHKDVDVKGRLWVISFIPRYRGFSNRPHEQLNCALILIFFPQAIKMLTL